MERDRIEKIEITDDILKQIKMDDIIAFTYAYSGAMGEPGAFQIYTLLDSKWLCYHGNYCYSNLVMSDVYDEFPEIKECIEHPRKAKNFKLIGLGMGNMLFLRNGLNADFERIHEENQKHIYQSYEATMQQVCQEKNIESIAEYVKNSKKSEPITDAQRQKLMDLMGNNLAGELMQGNNSVIEEALDKFFANSSRMAYRLEVFENFRIRLLQGAHIIVPGIQHENQMFVFGMWKNNANGKDYFIGFTSFKKKDERAGKDYIQMPFKGYIEKVLATDGVEGIVINPDNDKSYVMSKEMCRNLLNAVDDTTERLFFSLGDITKHDFDCIVNAANQSLLGGGGVDGAIHRAAGPELLEECRTLHGCNTGGAKITKGYNLPADYVIHTVGPIYEGLPDDAQLLANCYHNSLELAKKNNLHSIAFPAISTGAYGYPKQEAALIAVKTVCNWLKENKFYPMMVCFSSFDEKTDEIYSTIHRLYKE